MLRRTRAGIVVTFADGELSDAVAARVHEAAFATPLQAPATDWAAFDTYTARAMTRRQCAVFDRVLRQAREAA